MIELRQYKPDDAIAILKGDPRQPGVKLDEQTQAWAELKASRGPAVTAVSRGRVVACGGLEILWEGMAEGWCLFADDLDGNALSISRKVLEIMQEWIKEHKLVRIQAPMRADFKMGLRFAEWLGFKKEGVLQKYHPDGSDAIMYALITGE